MSVLLYKCHFRSCQGVQKSIVNGLDSNIAEEEDIVSDFTMQSKNFHFKFITGVHSCTVSSRLLEYETVWYKVMEFILSRLQDEQED